MGSTVLARYVNKAGRDALTLARHEVAGRVSYGYMGTLGAGSGKDEKDVTERAAAIVRNRRHVTLVEGVDIR